MPTHPWVSASPLGPRSAGVHSRPWGRAPSLPMPAAELCDRPVTVEQVWGRPAIAELRDRLATADGPHEMLTLLRSEEHTSELQSRQYLVCRLLLEKKTNVPN